MHTCHAHMSRRVLYLKPVILRIRQKLYVQNNLTLQTNMHFLGRRGIPEKFSQ